MNRAHVVVVGSINMDITVGATRIPGPGETVLGTTLQRSGGGKGANQAVSASRAARARTSFVGCLGADADGDALRASLTGSGVDTTGVRTVAAPTGTALVTVDTSGENAIVVVPGANACVDDPDPEQIGLLASADVVLAQLEIPADAVLAAARCRRPGALFILNAAPSAPLDRELWDEIDVLVVNEHESADLSGTPDVDAALAILLDRVAVVVVTLGSDGAILARRDLPPVRVAAPRVSAVDTTGAGDTFCGVLAAALGAGVPDLRALHLASAAGSLAVERPGAQDAVPTLDAVLARTTDTYGDSGEETPLRTPSLDTTTD